MKSTLHKSFIALAFIGLLTVSVSAQRGMGRGMGVPFYSTGTEMMVSGTVTEVQQLTGAPGTGWNCPRGWTGTHLTVKTDTGTMVVHVGPSAYLASNNFSIAKDDKVSILGSKVQYQGSDFLIAKQITKGSQILTLRDSSGFPLWSGRRAYPTPPPTN